MNMDNAKNYEYVELPSKGQCYPIDSPLRGGKVKMTYLTAMDENIIVSGKLKSKNCICLELLKKKVLDNIDVTQLCSGDKEAIILWMRNTGFGNIYKRLDTDDIIDLNTIRYKDFNILCDNEGHFSYITKRNDIITYRLLPFQEEEKVIRQSTENLKITEDENAAMEDVYKAFTTRVLLSMIVTLNDYREEGTIKNYLNSLSYEELRSFQRFVTYNSPGLDVETTNGIAFDDSIFYDIR